MSFVSEDMSSKTSIVIAEDHTLVREGIKNILTSTEQFNILGEASGADAAVAEVERLNPELLILDMGLPEKSGIEVLYTIREKGLQTKVIILTMHENELMAKQSILAGARAYILKDFTPQGLLETINKVLSGAIVLPQQFDHLREEIGQALKKAKPGKRPRSFEEDPLYKLSKREREVFFLLANGMPNRVIAKKLFISPRTVETHRARVIKKLGFKSTADLIRYAIKSNLLTP